MCYPEIYRDMNPADPILVGVWVLGFLALAVLVIGLMALLKAEGDE